MTEPEHTPTEPKPNLLERAVKAFDLGRFNPPPVPANLAPPRKMPAQRRIKLNALPVVENPHEAAVALGLPPMPESAPGELGLPKMPESLLVQRTESVAAIPPVPAAASLEPPVQPVAEKLKAKRANGVRFEGKKYPVNRQLLRDHGMIVPDTGVTAIHEEFRIVKRQLMLHAVELRQQGGGVKAQRVLICSPHPGEGKSYCAVNLALSIAAEKDSEVLLVDADFAKPSVLAMLGLPKGPGLMDALADPSMDIIDCVIGTDVPGLWVLPAGNATNSDSEFLSSSRTAGVLDRLTEGAPHRIVIFDSPPTLAASPAAELAKYVGQALLITRADSTGHSAVMDAISLLSGCPNIELLLNAASFSPSGRRFGAYYGYRG